MGDLIIICESCTSHAAHWVVHFDEKDDLPAEDYRVCNRCAMGLESQRVAM